MPRLSAIGTTFALLAVLVSAVLRPAPSLQAAAAAVGQVRFIDRGMLIQHQHQAKQAAHVKDAVYNADSLLTGRNQRASIGFHDGTVLHLNQDTDAIINTHLSQIHKGEVAEFVAPGTNHQVQTGSAVASSVGTAYDVRTDGSTSVFVVLHGALRVSNSLGAVTVKDNQQTTVPPNHAPLPPSPADAQRSFDWTAGIPTPDLGEDIALDAAGGQVAAFSSEREGAGDTGHVQHINDGLLSSGWESARGKTTNQTVTMGFRGGNFYRISDVIIDPAATYGDPSSEDLKNFAIRISSTGTDDASFTTVYEGRCAQEDHLQDFKLPIPVRAKYVQLVAQDNYGSRDRIAVAEWEVVATASLFAQPYGIAVAPSGAIYVADSASNRIDVLNSGGKVTGSWGKKGSKPGEFSTPSGVALDRKGNVYVADTYNSRIQKFSPKGKLLARFGVNGIHNGELFDPAGIAVDPQGNMYVADELPVSWRAFPVGRLQKLSPRGKVLDSWTFPAISTPDGAALDAQGNIYLADQTFNRVLEVSPSGQPLQLYGNQQGAQPGDPGTFSGPAGLAVDAAGNLYVADTQNDRIQKIDRSGHIVVWGEFGYGRGQYFFPRGIAIDAAGSLLVTDSLNSRIQKLSAANGKVLAVWGKYATVPQILGRPGGLAVDPHGDLWITDSQNDRVQVRSTRTGHVLAVFGYHGYLFEEKGTQGLGQFYSPRGIAIDKQGEVYVADTTNSRIEELAPRGPIGAFGGFGSGPGQFALSYDVALGPKGKIYALDLGHDRVQVFAHAGKNQHKVLQIIDVGPATAGLGTGFFAENLAVDHEGNMYVNSSTQDDRIVKFSPTGALLQVWGTWTPPDGDPSDRFFGPQGMFVDRNDHLWVADTAHGIVQELTTAGKTIAKFTEPGLNANPTSVTVDAHGYVYVADEINSQIFKFSPQGKVLARWR